MNKVFKNQKKIYAVINNRIDDVNLYFDIQKLFEAGCLDHLFEKKFKHFYRMNSTGLTSKHFKIYFQFLKNKENDLRTILTELYKIKTLNGQHSLQFSFTTKLLHTMDTNLPIYDRHVGKIFSIPTPNDTALPLDARLEKRLQMFNNLKENYTKLLSDKKIQKNIHNCRIAFKWSDNIISDTKVLDFMFWAAGQTK